MRGNYCYTPLRTCITHPAMKVGVVGIGGLRYMAVKCAKAMGAEVTVFSTSPDKEADAKEFGAHHFRIWENADEMKKAQSSQDLIVNAAPAEINWETALNLLANNGILCLVGLSTCSVNIPVTPLVFGQKSVVGSIVGGRKIID